MSRLFGISLDFSFCLSFGSRLFFRSELLLHSIFLGLNSLSLGNFNNYWFVLSV